MTVGSNGECTKGFNENTGASNCTLAEEDASCAATAICLARAGYDGPTGVGTPHGIAAFESAGEAARVKALEEQKSAEEKQADEEKKASEEHKAEEERLAERKAEEEQHAAEEKRAEEERLLFAEKAKATREAIEAEERARAAEAAERAREEAAIGVTPPPSQGVGGASTTGGGALSGGPLHAPTLATITPNASGLELSRTATVALSHGRPHVSRVAFAFTLNVPTRVRVTLAKRVIFHGRARWQTLPFSRTLTGHAGRNSSRLSATGTLAPGRYRLTLTPVGGAGRALTFFVG